MTMTVSVFAGLAFGKPTGFVRLVGKLLTAISPEKAGKAKQKNESLSLIFLGFSSAFLCMRMSSTYLSGT